MGVDSNMSLRHYCSVSKSPGRKSRQFDKISDFSRTGRSQALDVVYFSLNKKYTPYLISLLGTCRGYISFSSWEKFITSGDGDVDV